MARCDGDCRESFAHGVFVIWGLLFNRWTAYAVGAAVVVGAAYSYRTSLIQQGYDQAIAQVREAETDRLRELLKENARLVGVVKGLDDVAKKQKQDIADFRARQRVDAKRLRDQEAEHQRRLAAASAEAASRYAAHLDGNLDRCRGDVERFSAEAAECSVTAWKLKNYVDALP